MECITLAGLIIRIIYITRALLLIYFYYYAILFNVKSEGFWRDLCRKGGIMSDKKADKFLEAIKAVQEFMDSLTLEHFSMIQSQLESLVKKLGDIASDE